MKEDTMEKEISLQKLASKIAKVEGNKHEASIGDIREILKILCNLIAEELVPGQIDAVSPIEYCLWEESRVRREKLSRKRK